MRTIKDLLELMLEHQDLYDTGLCGWVNTLCMCDIISNQEGRHLKDYIKHNRPSKYSSLECFKHRKYSNYWKIQNLEPRIKWIKKHIKKLS